MSNENRIKAKALTFEALWTIANLSSHHALLIHCGKRDLRLAQGAYVFIERGDFLLDKLRKKTLPGQLDFSVARYASLSPDTEFIECAKTENRHLLNGLLDTLKPSDSPRIHDFCCDMARFATHFFMYNTDTSVLYDYGSFPPFGRRAHHYLSKISKAKGEGIFASDKADRLRTAYAKLDEAMYLLGNLDKVLMSCKVDCTYMKPSADILESPEAAGAHKRSELFRCLKQAAKKLMKGETC